MTENPLDDKISCLTQVIAEELGTILRCMVEQQIAAKQSEIDQRLLELRGLEMLISGQACAPNTGENQAAPST